MSWSVRDESRIVDLDGLGVAVADNYQIARAIADGLNLLEERLEITQDDEVGRIAWAAKLNEWGRFVNAHNPSHEGKREA